MAWRINLVEDQRKAFIEAHFDDLETMTDLCKKYDISRKTGYKWLLRHANGGASALRNESRAPLTQAFKTDSRTVEEILRIKNWKTAWGPKKIEAFLKTHCPEIILPSRTTIGNILERNGLTVSRKLRRRVPGRTDPLAHCHTSNDVWCCDFKGWFLTGDGFKYEPFTMTDADTRFLIRCVKLTRNDTNHVWPVVDRSFRECGLPLFMRNDNGPPFGSCGVGRLTDLSILIIKAGVTPEWIDPGEPQQNGRHERMHLTLKNETATPPASTIALQDVRSRDFVEYYNFIRPHEGIGQRTPGSIYTLSPRQWDGVLRSPEYNSEYIVRGVRHNGSIRWKGEEIYVGKTLTGEPLGLKEIANGTFEVHYGPVFLGVIDPKCEFTMPPGKKRRRKIRTI